MSDEHLFDEISGLKQSEVDIRHIFNQHNKTLLSQKWKMFDQIQEWSNTLIQQIQEYVTQQRDLLEQEYGKKVSRLNTIRDRVLEQVLIYEEKKDTEQINQLLNKCNNLKVELAMLTCIERSIPSIQVLIEEQLTHQNENEGDEQLRKKLTEEHDISNNTNTNETLLSKVPSTNTEPTNSPSSVTKSTDEDDQSITINDKSENNISSHDGLAEKCPICFMIFPQTMTVHHRNLHVNEHYKDD